MRATASASLPSLETAAALRMGSAPRLLVDRARTEPAGVAYRAKFLGIYRERTWRDYAEQVSRCAQGLAGVGVRRGDRVAIMGDAAEEWMICDLAVQSLGAISYGIYPTASPAEVEYQMRDGGAVVFVAEDQEYVDRILPIAARLPALAHVVVIDDGAGAKASSRPGGSGHCQGGAAGSAAAGGGAAPVSMVGTSMGAKSRAPAAAWRVHDATGGTSVARGDACCGPQILSGVGSRRR